MNIQRNLAIAVALSVGFVALPVLAAETTVTVEKTTLKHHFVYYGDHQIYFAPETKTYYWQQGDGNWHSGAMLPTESQGFVKTGGVELDLDTERPYERHEWVRKHYQDKHESGDKDDRDHH